MRFADLRKQRARAFRGQPMASRAAHA